MKELSIEERIKAAKEKLKDADAIEYNLPDSAHAIRTTVYSLFPELKESEDEKTRKALVRFHKSTIDIDGIKGEDIIAWLEKQSEQKPVEIVKWSPQEESCICQLESLVKEQWSHAEKVNNAVNIKKMQELMFFLKTLNPNKKPQRIISAEAKEAMYAKPAWSEEDELTRKALINLVELYYGGCFDKSEKNRLLDWLKSLKD